MGTTIRNPLLPPPEAQLGRIASVVIRYDDYEKFKAAVKVFDKLFHSPGTSGLPPEKNPENKRVHYFTPIGTDKKATELRLIYKEGNADKKGPLSIYYQIGGIFDTDEAARTALSAAANALKRQSNDELSPVESQPEADEESKPTLHGDVHAQRIVLNGKNNLFGKEGGTQVCLIANPPFPKGKDAELLRIGRVLAGLLAALGLGMLVGQRLRR